ncbi:MAG: T9SS type A sorting domain-containing protein [Calditrichaceae bacterium]
MEKLIVCFTEISSTNLSWEINFRFDDNRDFARNSEVNGCFFKSVLDEVKIFNVALDEQHIKAMYGEYTNKFMSKSKISLKFELTNSYPNPFNPTTKIKYYLPVNEFVSIKVYNMLGQVFKVLVNGDQIAGNHVVDFDALNLASGIYLYKMQAGKYSSAKKMILLR